MGERLFRPQDAYKVEDPERLIWLPPADVIQAAAASGVTSKAANGGHIKTGQRSGLGLGCFYSAAS